MDAKPTRRNTEARKQFTIKLGDCNVICRQLSPRLSYLRPLADSLSSTLSSCSSPELSELADPLGGSNHAANSRVPATPGRVRSIPGSSLGPAHTGLLHSGSQSADGRLRSLSLSLSPPTSCSPSPPLPSFSFPSLTFK